VGPFGVWVWVPGWGNTTPVTYNTTTSLFGAELVASILDVCSKAVRFLDRSVAVIHTQMHVCVIGGGGVGKGEGMCLHVRLPNTDTKRDSSVGIATGYVLDDPGSIPGMARIFSKTSRSTQGSTQPPIQRVAGTLSPGVKRPVREADHLYVVPRSGMVELYLHSLSVFSWHNA
jgi:hypothetical protein